MDAVDASDRDHRLHQVLAGSYEADETGEAPDRRILIERHPDLAADLAEFFEAQDRVHELAAPFRASGCRPGEPARSSTMTGDEPEGDTAFEAGRVFGDNEILGEIAHGGMGVVYRARQRGDEAARPRFGVIRLPAEYDHLQLLGGRIGSTGSGQGHAKGCQDEPSDGERTGRGFHGDAPLCMDAMAKLDDQASSPTPSGSR
jgi:hypothetical protein